MRAGGKGCTCECTCRPAIEDRPTFVYRAYSESGELLYVGITDSLKRRMKQHSKDPHGRIWYGMASRIESRLYPNRKTAHIIEQRELAFEGAVYNSVSDERLLKIEGPMERPVVFDAFRGGKGMS